MIDFKKAKYIISIPDLSFRMKDPYPEVVFLGRSNVGKSTLINSLTGQKLAFSSKKAGKTKYLNYFLVDGKYYLVDAPGYGYTAYGSKEDESFSNMMESYFSNEALKGAVLLLDCRRGLSEDDKTMVEFLNEDGIPFIVVFTKSDQALQSDKHKAKLLGESLGAQEVFFSSPKEKPERIRSSLAKMLEESK